MPAAYDWETDVDDGIKVRNAIDIPIPDDSPRPGAVKEKREREVHEKRKILACRRQDKRGWTECGNQVKPRLLARIQSRFVAVASVITYLEAMGTGARKGRSGRKRKGKGKGQSRVGSPARECRLDLDSAPTRGGVGYAGAAGAAAALPCHLCCRALIIARLLKD